MQGEKISEEQIYQIVLELFEEKGTHFTTLELANRLKTSKRTLYARFHGKEDILEKTIDYVFLDIIKSDHDILTRESLNTNEKISLFLDNLPKVHSMKALVRQFEDLKEYNPRLREKVESYSDDVWEEFICFLDEGKKKNEIEAIDTKILKMMLKEILKKLFQFQREEDIAYDFESTLRSVNKILLYGIYKR